jgi:hypothetical protein
VDTKIVERLRKILALTESPVEGEAHAAALKLQELLTEHNLSIADLEKRGAAIPQVGESAHDLGKAGFTWKLDLAETIADHYFCHAIVSRYRKTVSFVGRPDNVESLQMLYAWVIDQVKRISADERVKHKEETGEHIDPLRWQVNFGLGIVQRLGRRLREMREKEAADSKCMALVVHHKSEISDWLEAKGESRIDGKRTKTEQEAADRYEARRKADDELLRTNPEAYYDKYPWERPETDKEREAREKKEARNAARRTGRGYRVRYESAKEMERREQADTAHRSGSESANRINLQPFIKDGETKKRKEIGK